MPRLFPLLLCAACDPSGILQAGGAVQPHATPSLPVDADRFADDLRSHLDGWYAAHAVDVSGAGGVSLAEAVAAVDVSLVHEIQDPAEDPFGDDLLTTAVFQHPDVVFPGSDRVWFGAYRLSDGANLFVSDYE